MIVIIDTAAGDCKRGPPTELSERLPTLLEEQLRARIVRTGYFGGGFCRGSSVWIEECDALAVLGTPRVGSGAGRLHLLRLGKTKAAVLSWQAAFWGLDWWGGVRKSGERVTVRTLPGSEGALRPQRAGSARAPFPSLASLAAIKRAFLQGQFRCAAVCPHRESSWAALRGYTES